MQLLVTFVSGVMNNIFLSPLINGAGNLDALAELKRKTGLGVVFLSNHINANDPFVMTALFSLRLKLLVFPATYLTDFKKFDGIVLSFIMKLLGCLPVGDGKGLNVRETIRRIKNGESVFLFPEGEVSLDGELGEDHGALEYFSKFSDIIIQPIRIEGLKPFWDLKNMFLFRRKVQVSFGAPFVLKKGSKIDAMQLIKNVSREEQAELALES